MERLAENLFYKVTSDGPDSPFHPKAVINRNADVEKEISWMGRNTGIGQRKSRRSVSVLPRFDGDCLRNNAHKWIKSFKNSGPPIALK